MGKNILTFLTVLFSILIYSQDVKVKKEQILIDDTVAGTVKSPYFNHYDYYDLKGEKAFSVDFKGVSQASTAQPLQYLEITSADGSQKATVPHDILKTSFNVQTIITHNLTVKYHLFNKKGIDKEALSKLFSDTSNTSNIGDVAKQEIEAAAKRADAINGVKANLNPKITGRDISVSLFGGQRKVVGSIAYNRCSAFDTYDCIVVYDLDDNKIANVKTSKDGFRKFEIYTYDNKKFYYTASRQYLFQDNIFGEEFLAVLMAEGYELGHQAKKRNTQILNSKIADAKERSVNIYNVPGYAIDKDGQKTTGNITIYFQQLDVEKTGNVLPTEFADKFGQKVMVKYLNEKKQPRTKTLNASSGAKFCVETEEGTKCFVGLGVMGDVMKKLTNINDLSFNNAYFYTLLYEKKGIQILQDPVETQKYVVKIDKEDKGLFLDRNSDDTDAKRLAEYLQGCKKLSAEIKSKNFDVKNVEDLKQIADEYIDCK